MGSMSPCVRVGWSPVVRAWVLVAVGGFAPGCASSDGPDLVARASFDLPVAMPAGVDFTPLSLELGDFDDDSRPDLLVRGLAPPSVVTFATRRGTAAGTWLDPIDAGVISCSAYSAVGSIDGSAGTDLIIDDCGGQIDVLSAQGDGTFAPWSRWSHPAYALSASSVVADYEDDGDPDILTLDLSASQTWIRLAPLNGSAGVWDVKTTGIGNPEDSGFAPTRMTAGDFDGDGIMDVALNDPDTDVVLLYGTSLGRFELPLSVGVSVPPTATYAVSVDGDDWLDLVVRSEVTDEIEVLRGRPSGLRQSQVIDLGGFSPTDLAVTDLDNDGNVDLAIVDYTVAEARWYEGDGHGHFAFGGTIDLAVPALRVHAADVDNDAIVDLVLATYDDETITVVPGT